MTISFENRVAIVTGAGAGLGRSHALGLAARGAKVVVNDFGGGQGPDGGTSAGAEETVALIKAAGGEAIAHGADVANADQVEHMVAAAIERWGRVDILVNNAGILRDASFAKMTLAEWDAVMRVHATGAFVCTKACWPHMKAANYGRIVMTSSSSGLYGNFGQANYGAAKMALIGLMNVLHIEGAKNNIRISALAPGATTQMTRDLLPEAVANVMQPESVTPALLYLVSEDAPSRLILNATAGGFSRSYIIETQGIHLSGTDCTPEAIAAQFDALSGTDGYCVYEQGGEQVTKFITRALDTSG